MSEDVASAVAASDVVVSAAAALPGAPGADPDGGSSGSRLPRATRKATIAPMIAMRMIQVRRLPLEVTSGVGAGIGDADGVAVGLGDGDATATSVTTTWMPDFGLPLVMTGTPAAFRHDVVASPTSAVTT